VTSPQPPDATEDGDRPDEPAPHLVPPESVPPLSAEELVDGDRPEPDGDRPGPDGAEERRYPSTIGGAFYLLVLAVVAVGMGIVVLGDWRTGVRTMGGALLLAAVVRLVLRARDAGMLAVRHKWLDAAVLVLLGGLLIFLAGSIPDQPRF
jgi:hypothetical protein